MPNAPKTPTRTIRVADDLWLSVQKKAALEGVTVTSVIITALESYIKKDESDIQSGVVRPPWQVVVSYQMKGDFMSDIQVLTNEAKQYLALKEQISFLQDRQKEIKTRLSEAVKEMGEVDGRGHVTLELSDGIKITNQRRESRTLDEDLAKNLLKEKGIYEECVETVEVLQEDAIMAAVYKGQITEAEVDSMFPTKVTYAFLL